MLTADQADEIIRLLRILVEQGRPKARKQKRAETNRRRLIAKVQPSELEIAAARRALGR